MSPAHHPEIVTGRLPNHAAGDFAIRAGLRGGFAVHTFGRQLHGDHSAMKGEYMCLCRISPLVRDMEDRRPGGPTLPGKMTPDLLPRRP